jgi:integrase
VIKRGSASIKVYYTPTRGFDSYTLSYWIDGKRFRPAFASLEEAKREANEIAARLTAGETEAASMPREDRAAYARAIQLLQPTGVPLELAAGKFAEAHHALRGVDLMEAVRYYAKRNPADMPRKNVSEVVEELIERKKTEGRSYLYINDLKKLRSFAESFSCQISSVSGNDVGEWLAALNVAGRTKNNYRLLITTLMNYAKARKYIAFDHDEMKAVSYAAEDEGEIEIFKPSEMADILNRADPHMIPFLAIGAFAGVRHWEMKRLDWKEVGMAERFIEIKKSKAKTKGRRLVPLPDNLYQWLLPHAKPSGPVCTYSNMSEEVMYMARKLGIEWRHNALRHSFISYRVALTQNVNQVALEAGNSPSIIFSNYREVVRPADAQKWFAIVPETARNVIPIDLPRTASA